SRVFNSESASSQLESVSWTRMVLAPTVTSAGMATSRAEPGRISPPPLTSTGSFSLRLVSRTLLFARGSTRTCRRDTAFSFSRALPVRDTLQGSGCVRERLVLVKVGEGNKKTTTAARWRFRTLSQACGAGLGTRRREEKGRGTRFVITLPCGNGSGQIPPLAG